MIVGANRRQTRIEIVLPVDISGEYAFDEDGKSVRGKTPVTFTVPRYDCMDREAFKALNKAIGEIDDAKDDEGNPLPAHERATRIVVATVKPYVSDEVLKVVEGLHMFELEQIAELINAGSTVSVGELLASTSS